VNEQQQLAGCVATPLRSIFNLDDLVQQSFRGMFETIQAEHARFMKEIVEIPSTLSEKIRSIFDQVEIRTPLIGRWVVRVTLPEVYLPGIETPAAAEVPLYGSDGVKRRPGF
jgi:hypothetical protein